MCPFNVYSMHYFVWSIFVADNVVSDCLFRQSVPTYLHVCYTCRPRCRNRVSCHVCCLCLVFYANFLCHRDTGPSMTGSKLPTRCQRVLCRTSESEAAQILSARVHGQRRGLITLVELRDTLQVIYGTITIYSICPRNKYY